MARNPEPLPCAHLLGDAGLASSSLATVDTSRLKLGAPGGIVADTRILRSPDLRHLRAGIGWPSRPFHAGSPDALASASDSLSTATIMCHLVLPQAHP